MATIPLRTEQALPRQPWTVEPALPRKSNHDLLLYALTAQV